MILTMKRAIAFIVLISAFCILLLGCDSANLPTQVVSTPTAAPTQPAASPTAEAPTATPPAPAETATVEPPTEAPTSPPTEAATVIPSPTAAEVTTPAAQESPSPAESTPGTRPTATATRPRVTGTPTNTPANSSSTGGVGEPTATEVSIGNLVPATGPWAQVVRVAPGKHRIALTFDAGASGETWPRIMAAFRERGLHITMFFTGKFAEQYPDAIKQAVADGNELANHTYTHPDMRTLTDAQMVDELSHTENIITGLTGVSTKPYWRPPFGAYNNHVLAVAATQGYRSIYWTLDSLDSVGQPKTPDFIFNRVTNTPGVNLDGAIVLQHFGSEASAEALPRELDRLKEMGLQVCTISELISP